MIPSMKTLFRGHLLFIFLAQLLIFGCGQNNSEGILQAQMATVKPNLNYIRTLNGDEVNIALRVCYALKTKRIKFKADLNGTDFHYQSTEKKCDGASVEKNYQSKLKVEVDGKMTYETDYQGFYLSEVPTDLNSPMQSICEKLFQGEIPDNTFQTTPHQRNQFEFYHKEGIDVVNIHNGVKDSKDTALDGYLTNFVTIYEFNSFPSNPNMTGVIERYHRITDCQKNKDQKSVLTLKVKASE